MTPIEAATANLSRVLPSPQILGAVTAALQGRPAADSAALSALNAALGTAPAIRAAADRLTDAWRAAPSVSGSTLAAMLATGYAAATGERSATVVQPVVTGPQSKHVPLRLTRQAFERVAGAAAHDLLVLTYSAYAEPRIAQALTGAIGRGVRVRLLIESTHDAGGTLKQSALDALRDIPADFYIWSPDHRPESYPRPSMHAKAIVADRCEAFVTSANLSGYAFEQNIEVGIHITGGHVPGRLADHFAALIASDVFVPAGD